MNSWRVAQLQKLIAALFLENFAGFQQYLDIQDSVLRIQLDARRMLELSLDPDDSRERLMIPFVIDSDSGQLIDQSNNTSSVTLESMVSVISSAPWWPVPTKEKAAALWQETLRCGQHIVTNKFYNEVNLEHIAEQFAIKVDRPNHPFAHSKGALAHLLTNSKNEVRWWAFPKKHVITRQNTNPSTLLLDNDHQQRLQAAMKQTFGPQAPDYVALPVLLSEETTASDFEGAQPLRIESDLGRATSSLRTFFANHRYHIKLAVGTATLGAKRTMPPRYLINGDEAHCLLKTIISKAPVLNHYLLLCDEQQWWSCGQSSDLTNSQGEIGLQVRLFPKLLKPQLPRFTMAALNHPKMWDLLEEKGYQAATLFQRLIPRFIYWNLCLWQFGVMPECHGQNLQLFLNDDDQWHWILRDYDTLRIHPKKLKQNRINKPNYHINWTTPNTLVLESQEQLLRYFTTLGLQVNLYPIAMALVERGDIQEREFWQWLHDALEQFIQHKADPESSTLLQQHVITSERWPFKAILQPLLDSDRGATGMPSAMTTISNPFQRLVIKQSMCHSEVKHD